MELRQIPMNKIVPPTKRARKDFGDIISLKKSIEENGLINPITVKEREDGFFDIIAGERRWRACSSLGWKEIPAHILPKGIDMLDQRVIELHENLYRKDFTWQEEVMLKKQIHDLQVQKYGEKETSRDEEGWSLRKTAELLGESPANVSKDIQVAEMMSVMPELRRMETKGKAYKAIKNTANMLRAQVVENMIKKEASSDKDSFRKKIIESYIIGDFLEEGKKLQKGIFDLIEIDPPYGISLQDAKKEGAENVDYYNEIPESDYEEFLNEVMRVVTPLLKPDSWLIMWYAPEPYQEIVYKVLTRFRINVRRLPGIWVKPIGQTRRPEYYMASDWEPFYYGRVGKPTLAKQGRSSVFQFSRPGLDHPTAKPLQLYIELLSTFCRAGANILVPFAGSGMSILAAHLLGMKAIGYDKSEYYKSVFVNEVMKVDLDTYLKSKNDN